MNGNAFVSPTEAAALIRSGAAAIDCRFRLTEPEWGRTGYAAGHLPGAVYAHLDSDLAAIGAAPGRHPLPRIEDFLAALHRWGVGARRPVVVYDDAAGAIAARAWWLLRWVGHRGVAILDGGWQAWLEAGLEVEAQEPAAPPPGDGDFNPGEMPAVDSGELERALGQGSILLIDARSRERFRGEREPIDARAGHVPGAVNRPYEENLSGGRLKARARLERDWTALLGERAPREVVHMCGSGVTACFNLAVMEHLGRTGSALYAGSWSGWIEDPEHPLATG